MVAVDEVGRPRRPARGRDDRIETMFGHGGVDAFGAREAVIFGERGEIGFIRERSFGLRLEENLLPEIWHLALAVPLVELDDLFERTGHARAALRQITV